MTILQLKYVIAIANAGAFREAASRLFVSQPALSSPIRELEEELGMQLFERTNKGIRLTEQGNEFLIYAKEAVSQYELIEDRFIDRDKNKKHISVSMQHYVFAVHAFVSTVKNFDTSKYVYSVYETRTDEVLNNVKNLKSEIGVISYSNSNEKVLKKLFREYQLKFVPLMVRDTYAYVWKDHPLADKTELSLKELEEYPCVSFDQSSESDFYLSEEALGDYEFNKLIKSNDRATTAELMSALNGYSIGTGNMIDSMALSTGSMSMNYTIRKTLPNDVDKITELEKICFPKEEAATRDSFIERLNVYANHFIVVESEDDIICVVNGLVTNHEDLLDEMYADANYHNEDGKWQMIFGVETHPDYQGRGIASMALQRFIDLSLAEGRKGLVLTCKKSL